MKPPSLQYLFASTLACAVALAGCNKKEEAAVAPAVIPPAPVAAPAPAPTPPPPPVQAPVADLTVVSIDLGNTVGTDMRVAAPATTFAPKDTIHASIATTGTASEAEIGGKWLYQDGQTVNESLKTVSTTGPATHDFSISKPDGFPAGNYKFELWVNGALAEAREFAVK